MAVDGIGGSGPGQAPTPVRALLAEISLVQARALAATLTAGEIISGRVGADLGNGNVALTVRGQTLVANSQTPLLPDSLVKLLVQSTGDQPVLRLLAAVAPDAVATSTSASRAIALGLPATAAATTALQAFEQAGAPLDPVRIREAAEQLQALPPAQVPQRAAALAALAQAGLPATPPFIALAERSASGVLPNPAAAVVALQDALRSAGGTTATPTAAPNPVPAANVQPPAGGQPPVSSSQPPVAGSQPPVAGSQPPVVSGQQPAVSGQQPVASGQPPVTGGQPVVSADQPSLVSSLSSDTPETVAPPAPAPAPAAPAAATPPPAAPPTAAPPPVPAAPAAVVVPVPSPAAAPVAAPVLVPTPTPVPVATAGTQTLSPAQVATAFVGTPMPDLARGGALAVLQALALAGVRPRDTGEMTAPRPEPLLHRLALPLEEVDPVRPVVDSTTRQTLPPDVQAAIAHVMREQAAETVVKPQGLVDYDLVVGLPLQVNGQPMPARFAVAERQTSGGTATFLRVDAELSNLGPLSVRISGIENGPMAITVLATGPALVALADAMPDLNESLRSLGLTAGLRLADLAEDLAHG